MIKISCFNREKSIVDALGSGEEASEQVELGSKASEGVQDQLVMLKVQLRVMILSRETI